MPQNSAIAIKDGALTPVTHTYYPTGIDGIIASFIERSGAVPIGQASVSWSLRAPNKQSATYKLVGKLVCPEVVTVTDVSGKTATVVDYTNLATVELVLSNKSTKQQRTDLRTLVSNLLLAPTIVASVDDLESFW